jgi:hypothetical protein
LFVFVARVGQVWPQAIQTIKRSETSSSYL